MNEREKQVYQELAGKTPAGHRLNELIPFSYPLREIRLTVLANKSPDGSLLNVYQVFLKAIQAGFCTKNTLFDFLGLGEKDEFMERELFLLRQKGLLDLAGENWLLTEAGKQFLEDHTILRVEEELEFGFFMDGISGEIISKEQAETGKKLEKHLAPAINLGNRSPALLDGKFQELADVFKSDNKGQAYLLNYSTDNINYDKAVFQPFWLVEYVPQNGEETEPYLEIRQYENLTIEKRLSQKFNREYRHYIGLLTDSERVDFGEIAHSQGFRYTDNPVIGEKPNHEPNILGVWETKQKFIEALSTAKERVLIESPWIKRATLEYIHLFEKLLQGGKELVILYGIGEKDDHHYPAIQKLEELRGRFPKNFQLIHLPTYLSHVNPKLTGTHRKLVIKDHEYYLTGSFNFLSFHKNEDQFVANEETILVRDGVAERWGRVFSEYLIPSGVRGR